MFTTPSGSRRLSKCSQLSASWAQPPQHAAGDPKAGQGESAGPSQVPGWGRKREEFRGSEKGRLHRKTMRAFQKEKAKKKGSAREHSCLRSLFRAGGAEPPPSGRVVASQTTGVPGCHPRRRGGCLQRNPASAERGRREEEGDLFELGGWASGRKKQKQK